MNYGEAAWKRLGKVIDQRRAVTGLADNAAWAARVGVTYRQLSEPNRGKAVGPKTLAAIEAALGWSAGRAYEILAGEEAEPSAPPVAIPSTDEGLMEFEVSGDFGVRVIVKGPVSNARELEQSVSRLIQDIRRSDEERDARSHG